MAVFARQRRARQHPPRSRPASESPVLAAVTGIGGGTLRDLLLNRHPGLLDQGSALPLYDSRRRRGFRYSAKATYPACRQPFSSPMHSASAYANTLSGLHDHRGPRPIHAINIVVLTTGTLSGVAGGVIRDLLSGVVPLLLAPRYLRNRRHRRDLRLHHPAGRCASNAPGPSSSAS